MSVNVYPRIVYGDNVAVRGQQNKANLPAFRPETPGTKPLILSEKDKAWQIRRVQPKSATMGLKTSFLHDICVFLKKGQKAHGAGKFS